jgi:small subunit ribosomal protein S17
MSKVVRIPEVIAKGTQSSGPWFRGVVISPAGKMQKTVVVAVDRPSWVWKYSIQINRKSKFFAHDEHNICDLGDVVVLRHTKPLSKRKDFFVHSILAKEPGAGLLRVQPELQVTQTGLGRAALKRIQQKSQNDFEQLRRTQQQLQQLQQGPSPTTTTTTAEDASSTTTSSSSSFSSSSSLSSLSLTIPTTAEGTEESDELLTDGQRHLDFETDTTTATSASASTKD